MNLKRYIVAFFLAGAFLLGSSQSSNIVEGELLIMLVKDEPIESFKKTINTSFPNFQLKTKERISRKINLWLVTYNSDSYTSNQALEIVNSSPRIVVAQFNHTNIMMRADTCPTDPNFSSLQWNMKNTGQSGGTVGADIDACKAWGITTQDTTALGDTIVVAVIDNGFYLSHEDINFFRNYNEIPFNGIDDDGNGYIDDTLGWNTYNDTNRVTSRSHGTHVSGIIGAKANNGVGVAGVNWGMKVLAIQGSSGLESTVLKSYGYALEMRALYDSTNGSKGAFVVATNSSFGLDFADATSYPLWCAFYDSLGAYGIISCAATSNSNIHVDVSGDMPTTCTSNFLIGVTNTTRNDNKATAGYGATHIDMGAPGTSIRSTYPGDSYFTTSGTSMSTPHVAGAVAFMYAAACENFINLYKSNPDSIALEVRKAVIEEGDSIFALQGITASGNRLNLYNSAFKIRTSGACSLTSTKEIEEDKSSIFLYPNPNNGNFNLKLQGFYSGDYSYTVIDLSGKTIMTDNVIINSESQVTPISSDNFDNGVYFFCLKSSKGIQKNIKFVVNK